MKKLVLVIWLIAAVAAFLIGLLGFMSSPSWETYLTWGGMCAIVSVVHLIIDFFSRTRDGCLVYLVLSVVLGPVLILLFMYVTLKTIFDRGVGQAPTRTHNNVSNSNATGCNNNVNETDTRLKDFGMTQINKAVARGIDRAKGRTPDFYYGYIENNWSVSKSVSRLFGISVSGTVKFRIDHCGEGDSVTEAVVNCISEINQAVVDCIGEELDKVCEQYQGYDGSWDISSELKPELEF